VLTAAATAEVDAAATDPVEVLMERAGLAVALAAVAMGASYGRRVLVLSGPGNNGGDGYVAARYLRRRGVAVRVLALTEPRSRAAQWAHGTAVAEGVPVERWRAPLEADLVIDGLFGAGFRGALPEHVIPWTGGQAPVLSIDVPSGLDATTGRSEGPVFRAARTITFHSYKVGHFIGIGPEVCGSLQVADIGLTGGEAEFLLTEEEDAVAPVRPRTAHKWSAGSVMVVGGAPGMTGAALLAAASALGTGAGSVLLAAPAGIAGVYASAAPGLLTAAIGSSDRFTAEDAIGILERAERFDVMAVGPGIGSAQSGFVKNLLERWGKPMVVDADGINAIGDPDPLRNRQAPLVLTPHAGEFRRLTGHDADHAAARSLARDTATVVLLKGNPTFIAGEQLWMVDTGGPELATIGTGDVLTGMVAAYLARGLTPEAAARTAAYWHGRAGGSLERRETVTAERLVGEVRSVAP
jgi:NAD(P)H-hydrate epimerase